MRVLDLLLALSRLLPHPGNFLGGCAFSLFGLMTLFVYIAFNGPVM